MNLVELMPYWIAAEADQLLTLPAYRVTLAGGATLRFVKDDVAEQSSQRRTLRCRLGDNEALITLVGGADQQIAPLFAPENFDLPEPLWLALAETALKPLLNAMSDFWQCAVQVVDVATQEGQLPFVFADAAGTTLAQGALTLPDSAMALLHDWRWMDPEHDSLQNAAVALLPSLINLGDEELPRSGDRLLLPEFGTEESTLPIRLQVEGVPLEITGHYSPLRGEALLETLQDAQESTGLEIYGQPLVFTFGELRKLLAEPPVTVKVPVGGELILAQNGSRVAAGTMESVGIQPALHIV